MFMLGATEGTACTVTSTDPSQQGECRTADYCTSESGNLLPSGDCWQAPYNGGGSRGTQELPTWGCCVGESSFCKKRMCGSKIVRTHTVDGEDGKVQCCVKDMRWKQGRTANNFILKLLNDLYRYI